jgi:hypothetical protein
MTSYTDFLRGLTPEEEYDRLTISRLEFAPEMSLSEYLAFCEDEEAAAEAEWESYHDPDAAYERYLEDRGFWDAYEDERPFF